MILVIKPSKRPWTVYVQHLDERVFKEIASLNMEQQTVAISNVTRSMLSPCFIHGTWAGDQIGRFI